LLKRVFSWWILISLPSCLSSLDTFVECNHVDLRSSCLSVTKLRTYEGYSFSTLAISCEILQSRP
jgi:hypothetical protein